MSDVVTLNDNLLSEYQKKIAGEVGLESGSYKYNACSDVVSLKI